MKKVIAVIPAYNAEKTIKNVIQRIPQKLVNEIIVVDDGSKDRTYDVAISTGVKVIRHETNKGYGGAQKTGFKEALKDGATIIVLLHADGQHAPEEIPILLKSLTNKEVDVVLGSRALGKGMLKGKMPFYKFIGNRILTFVENMAFGTHISEFHTGYRAYKQNVLNQLNFENYTNDYHFDSEILLDVHEKKFKIEEVPISTHYGDEKSYVNSFTYGMNIIFLILRHWIHKFTKLFKRIR